MLRKGIFLVVITFCILLQSNAFAVEWAKKMQDLGAGGLSTALPEMAYRGGVGVELYTDKVPTREPLTPYEVVLSESQERMVLCVEKGKEEEIISIFKKWGLTAAVIGKVISKKVFRILYKDEILAEIPLPYIFKSIPKPEWISYPEGKDIWEFLSIFKGLKESYKKVKGRHNQRKFLAYLDIFALSMEYTSSSFGLSNMDRELKYETFLMKRDIMLGKVDDEAQIKMSSLADYEFLLSKISKLDGYYAESVLSYKDVKDICLGILRRPNVSSKKWIYRQYDHMVGTDTVIPPGEGDAAIMRIKGKKWALALTVDGSAKFIAIDPYWGTQRVATEACLNIICSGGEVIGFTDGINFPSPSDPTEYWKLQESIRALSDFSKRMGIPVVSGNVSLYNESERFKVLPTVIIGAVGVLKDINNIVRIGVERAKLRVYVVGFPQTVFDLGGSEFLLEMVDRLNLNAPTKLILKYTSLPRRFYRDIDYVKSLMEALKEIIRYGFAVNMHDISEGGLFAALSEMVINGKVGIAVKVDGFGELFSELAPRVVLTTDHHHEVESILAKHGVLFENIGLTIDSRELFINYYEDKSVEFGVDELREAYYETFENIG